MILAFTGAGISRASGIPTFGEQPGLRDKLSRSFAKMCPEEYQATIAEMQAACDKAEPNDAHFALAEYDVPIITMNVDGLHQKAGSRHVLEIHGRLPDIVLYGDPAPRYEDANNWVFQLQPEDVFLVVGTSFYTGISGTLKHWAERQGAMVHVINSDAEHLVRTALETHKARLGDFKEFLSREYHEPLATPYSVPIV